MVGSTNAEQPPVAVEHQVVKDRDWEKDQHGSNVSQSLSGQSLAHPLLIDDRVHDEGRDERRNDARDEKANTNRVSVDDLRAQAILIIAVLLTVKVIAITVVVNFVVAT